MSASTLIDQIKVYIASLDSEIKRLVEERDKLMKRLAGLAPGKGK